MACKLQLLQSVMVIVDVTILSGKAVALRLAQDGFNICVNDIEANAAGVDEVVKEIQGLGRKAYGHIADVTNADAVNTMVTQSVDKLGPLNVMVANAGIVQVKRLLDHTDDDIRKLFDVNYFGVYNSYAAAARQFIKQGGGGKIIGAARYGLYHYLSDVVPLTMSTKRCCFQTLSPTLAL